MFLFKFGLFSGRLLENSCSAYDIFSKYKYLMVNLVFPTLFLGVGVSFFLRVFLIIACLYIFS